jgi:hypothetical protein
LLVMLSTCSSSSRRRRQKSGVLMQNTGDITQELNGGLKCHAWVMWLAVAQLQQLLTVILYSKICMQDKGSMPLLV